jgi:hypothetical protein
MNRNEMIDHIREQDMEIFSLIARVIEVIKNHHLWGGDDEYVFDDGEVWYRFDPDYMLAKNTGKLTEEDKDYEY